MLRIALTGDLHYPKISEDDEALLEARDQFFSGFMKAFLETKADLHISIGDTTHNGLAEEFEAVQQRIAHSQATYRQVLGNHDILALPKGELLAITNQPRYDRLETDTAILLFLDTTKSFELHGWGLDEEQWLWLESQIESSTGKLLMIFAHHPVPDPAGKESSPSRIFQPYQDLRPLLRKRDDVAVYFNGHAHFHSIIQQDSWVYVQTAAPICHPSFRLIEYDGGQIRVRTIAVEEESILRGRDILYQQLQGFYRPSMSPVSESDLELDLRIKNEK